MSPPLISLSRVSREYVVGTQRVCALVDVDLRIERGEFVAIVGASGSGKSTLMNVLGCLDRPSAGRYLLDGRDTADLDADALARARRETFGFIFQRYNLLPHQDATHNVALPAVYAGVPAKERARRAAELLSQLGLGDRLRHKPTELSGGQQQRVSIARALMNGGPVLLADEPTGALDSQAGADLLQMLQALHRQGHTVIVVTHDARGLAASAQRIVEISDGRLVSDRRREAASISPDVTDAPPARNDAARAARVAREPPATGCRACARGAARCGSSTRRAPAAFGAVADRGVHWHHGCGGRGDSQRGGAALYRQRSGGALWQQHQGRDWEPPSAARQPGASLQRFGARRRAQCGRGQCRSGAAEKRDGGPPGRERFARQGSWRAGVDAAAEPADHRAGQGLHADGVRQRRAGGGDRPQGARSTVQTRRAGDRPHHLPVGPDRCA